MFSSNRETIYEVEVELTELEFLKQSLSQRDQFRSVFLRFLRNLESLYLGREALFEPYYSKFCSGAPREIPKPLCGDYMMNEAIKNEKLKKKIMNKINK